MLLSMISSLFYVAACVCLLVLLYEVNELIFKFHMLLHFTSLMYNLIDSLHIVTLAARPIDCRITIKMCIFAQKLGSASVTIESGTIK